MICPESDCGLGGYCRSLCVPFRAKVSVLPSFDTERIAVPAAVPAFMVVPLIVRASTDRRDCAAHKDGADDKSVELGSRSLSRRAPQLRSDLKKIVVAQGVPFGHSA
jgi:hypothetical protein